MKTHAQPSPIACVPDRELLGRFATHRDEDSFEEIVRRHGPLVLGVCRRVLSNRHDAEDAFQATFAVLAKSAAKIRKRASLASWLYGVAYRVSNKVAKRKYTLRQERLVAPMCIHAASKTEDALQELARRGDEEIVDAELHALPDRYLGPMVLRYLEDRSNQQIAEQLDLSETAVEGRLKRGRAELRRRLLRRGVTLTAFAAVVSASQQAIAAEVTPALVHATVQTGAAFAAGKVSSGLASHQLAQLEIARMTIAAQRLASFATVIVLGGLGLYGIVSVVAGQESSSPGKRTSVHISPVERTDERSAAAGMAIRVAARTNAPARPQSRTVTRGRQAIERIASQLDNDFAADFSKESLWVVAAYFQEQLRVPVLIDWKSLEETGIAKESGPQISFHYKGLSIRSALRHILDQQRLEYAIEDDVLLITTPEGAQGRLDTRVYEAADMGLDPDTLIELVTRTISPESWNDVGGPGVITAVTGNPGLLVIAQTQRVHEQIDDLFGQLHRATQD